MDTKRIKDLFLMLKILMSSFINLGPKHLWVFFVLIRLQIFDGKWASMIENLQKLLAGITGAQQQLRTGAPLK